MHAPLVRQRAAPRQPRFSSSSRNRSLLCACTVRLPVPLWPRIRQASECSDALWNCNVKGGYGVQIQLSFTRDSPFLSWVLKPGQGPAAGLRPSLFPFDVPPPGPVFDPNSLLAAISVGHDKIVHGALVLHCGPPVCPMVFLQQVFVVQADHWRSSAPPSFSDPGFSPQYRSALSCLECPESQRRWRQPSCTPHRWPCSARLPRPRSARP